MKIGMVLKKKFPPDVRVEKETRPSLVLGTNSIFLRTGQGSPPNSRKRRLKASEFVASPGKRINCNGSGEF